MRVALLCLATLIAAICLPVAGGPALAQKANITAVPTGDPDMAAAVATARQTLPEFWAVQASPPPGVEGFALKVSLPVKVDGADTLEHIWVNAIERLSADNFAARLGNNPVNMPGRKMGDRVEFAGAQISDWMFIRNGKIVGNETLRPMFKLMPKDRVDMLRQMMEKP